MSKRRLVITAVLAGASQSEVARRYDVSQGWVSRLMARYRAEGAAAFEPRSRRPRSSPRSTFEPVTQQILALRKNLADQGHDAGAETIAWHLNHHHDVIVSRSTIHRILTRHGAVAPEPAKRPRSSYIRFAADQPNETWQSDFTHYRLTHPGGRPGSDVEIVTWLDDHSRYALHITAHRRITAKVVLDTFIQACDQHEHPASVLTDNGMVYTVRFAGRPGGRNHLEHELYRQGITQKNGRPNHPTTQGKVERFQQTMKKWLRAQRRQPATLAQLQALLTQFAEYYNNARPHRALPHRCTPATAYAATPKAAPHPHARTDSHDRLRRDKIDTTGCVTLRIAGKLRHIGIGRPHAGTHVLLLVHDHDVKVINAATGEILRELTIDLTRDYQPRRTKIRK
ncbi:IS481 family transposase [Isoptericola sediminis]|uniref:IS481 family transposase n=1 Tax=Isoptericola sediminis TaxID=2733572 RepID=A0A849K1N7_9MICO|nr:IS481 family transposase [Isoptericola sediminis]